jgi:subtilase family serine protease
VVSTLHEEKNMTLQRLVRKLTMVSVITLFTVGGFSTYAQVSPTNVPAGIQLSQDLGLADPSTEISITVHLKLSDRAAFDKAVDALYDPASPTFHQWMTNADLKKYAPTEEQRQTVRQELQNHGLTILSADSIGFGIRAHGTIANVESAFHTEIHQFQHNGKTFRANVRNAQLSGEAGNYISSVAGLESHQVQPLYARALNPRTQKTQAAVSLGQLAEGSGFPAGSTTQCLSAPATYKLKGTTRLPVAVYTGNVYSLNENLICDYLPAQLQSALGLTEVYAAGINGAGQTIVLVEAYGYPTLEKDANAFFKMANLPELNSSNFSIVYPQGKPNPKLGILSGWNIEMAIDLQWAHTIAPGANIIDVVAAGQDSESFQNAITYVADNQLGNQVSNSYEEDVDLFAGPLEQTSWDDTIEVASAKGISVNFSSGDSGDNGVGSPLGAPGVPSNSPHGTAVGGTSILNDVLNPNSTITTGWGDTVTVLASEGQVADPPVQEGLFGGSGGGESVFFPKPSWQKSLPGKGRQTPDVSALADPQTGVPIVLTAGNAQEVEFDWGGTSLSCPIFTGFWALANQKAGHSLGQAAPAIAALPYGGVQDVLPTTDSTPTNLTGVITDQNGSTTYSASDLFSEFLDGNKGFTSAIWPPSPYVDIAFGLDSSLTVHHGWDNVTGFGTPYGITFINAVTANKK